MIYDSFDADSETENILDKNRYLMYICSSFLFERSTENDKMQSSIVVFT